MSISPKQPLTRHALNGPTMGTRWSALFFAEAGFDTTAVQRALQNAVDAVDSQMSTWNPRSDLMQFNAAPIKVWVELPRQLIEVIKLGLEIGHTSGGAFDIGMGDAVTAWGFGPAPADQRHVHAALTTARKPAHEVLEIKGQQVRKSAPLTLDLNGIAKGYGVDCLAETLITHGYTAGLVGIDGEMRALGLHPDGHPWTLAVESPETGRRTPHSILTLQDAAVATSGDYRHWVEVQGRRLSHTMDPHKGGPLTTAPASVTVVAQRCAVADAWATALMVLGPDQGARLAQQQGLDALILQRDSTGHLKEIPVGQLFS